MCGSRNKMLNKYRENKIDVNTTVSMRLFKSLETTDSSGKKILWTNSFSATP